jgi:chemotaxis protein CheX
MLQAYPNCVHPAGVIPPVIVEAVTASVEKLHATFFSEQPILTGHGSTDHDHPCIASIISFLGEIPWSLTWILPTDTAPMVAKKFTGFEIPFESSDMGDLVGELINVFAGEVVVQLELREIDCQMSLPTVLRGNHITLVPELGASVVHLQYESKEGPFWFRLAAAKYYGNRVAGS